MIAGRISPQQIIDSCRDSGAVFATIFMLLLVCVFFEVSALVIGHVQLTRTVTDLAPATAAECLSAMAS